MPINTEWHRTHPMPKHPTPEERAAWHVEHARFCGCREMPDSVRKWIAAGAGTKAAPRGKKAPGKRAPASR